MSMTDPIADFLTRIRNASRAKHPRVDIPASKMKKELAVILAQEKFIKGYNIIEFESRRFIRVLLKYQPDGQGVIAGLERVSKPGRRVYVNKDNIPRVLNGLGVAVMSTSRGILTDKMAKQQGLGGEVICKIW
ncbi:30S ribosomal protein S8 [bacterium]|nr:30S ribosomal protein S8 [bacterium]